MTRVTHAGETVLVVGGAGYIGSHTCLDLANKGYKPVVFDNFSNGHREFVKWGPAEEGDIRDRARLDEVLAKHKPAAILHFAALIEVGESVKDPVSFYENNVIGTLTLLSAAQAAGINAFVFSSTCATYGLPQSVPLDETHRQMPINPYGRTKYIVEQALADYDQYKSLRSVVLRYFNAAGAISKAGSASGTSRKRMRSRWRSTPRSVAARASRYSAATTRRATAPACVITSMCSILPMRMCAPSNIC